MSDAVQYDQLADALRRAGLSPDPSHYHGALCGALCTGAVSAESLISLLEAERAPDAIDDATVRQLLAQLRDTTAAALTDEGASFDLVLPADAQGLAARTRALASWCDGFLYGLASNGKLDLERASDDVREAVSDITQFTRATLEQGDDAETEENAFTELVEYLRVVVQLIHLELHGKPGNSGKRRPMH